jgi:hypothetical protein
MAVDKYGIKKICASKDGGRSWYSDAWSKGPVRVVGQNEFDPVDPKLGMTAAELTINGDGTATVAKDVAPGDYSGGRVFVSGPWKNTEMTAYIRLRGNCPQIHLRSRSNHHGVQSLPYGHPVVITPHDTSPGWGNYLVKWENNSSPPDYVMIEVEPFHPVYKRELDKHTITDIPSNTWLGFKQITRNIVNSRKVRVEGYINRDISSQSNWVKDTAFTFTGDNVDVVTTGFEDVIEYCLDKGDRVSGDVGRYTVWRHFGKWCWLRFEGLANPGISNIDIKYFSIREINYSLG